MTFRIPRFIPGRCINQVMVASILVVFVMSCSSRNETEVASENIAVRWSLVTNFTDKPDVFEAKIELINNSARLLDHKNWTLFFNMAPRQILAPPAPQPASLYHINGDWYKLVPSETFSLQPGSAVTIT